MSEIVYREIEHNDYEYIIDLIDETWEFSRYISNPVALKRGIRCIFLSSLLTSSCKCQSQNVQLLESQNVQLF